MLSHCSPESSHGVRIPESAELPSPKTILAETTILTSSRPLLARDPRLPYTSRGKKFFEQPFLRITAETGTVGPDSRHTRCTEVEALLGLNLGEETKRKILFDNAVSLFPITARL